MHLFILAAKKLSDLVRVLDIGDKIQQKLIAKRTYANAQCALLATELNGMTFFNFDRTQLFFCCAPIWQWVLIILELKKIAESQEKKQREVKRKSELLDHLIGNLQDQKRKRRGSSATAPSGASSMTAIAVPTSPNDASPNDEWYYFLICCFVPLGFAFESRLIFHEIWFVLCTFSCSFPLMFIPCS